MNNRDALVVGINYYPKINSLGKPAQDAEEIAQLLETSGHFHVRRLPEIIENDQRRIDSELPTTEPVMVKQLKEALAQLFNPTGNNVPDTALFFFAGHGVREESGGIEEGYLATSDANPEFEKFGISLQWLRRLLEKSPIRQQIIWLDCCHSGELLNFDEGNPGDKGHARDRCFIAASREFEPAYEQLAGNHGVLTAALLDGLAPTDQGAVNNHTLTDFVQQRLKGEIQRPVFHNSGEEIILTTVKPTQVPKEISIRDTWPDFDLDNYAQRVKTRYRVLDLSGLTPPARDDLDETAPVLLKDVFVQQWVKENRPPRELPKEMWEKLQNQGELEPDELSETLSRKDFTRLQQTWAQTKTEMVLTVASEATNQRLILLGDPGSGKSTLARYFLLSVLEPPRDKNGKRPDWLDTFSGHLPLLIELRHYIGEIAAKNCLGFLEYFHYLGKTQGYTLNHQALKQQLKTRASVLIFDGLDEIFDPIEREKITQEIIGFAMEYPKARVIVTSRIIGYQGKALQAADFSVYTLQDLADEQIKTFARGWFDIVYPNKPDDAEFRYQRIDTALKNSAAIRQLAGNPLLLTMIAIIAKHQELPRERAKLYEHAAKVLCHHWEVTGHKIPITETPADFMLEDDKLELLRRIAWRMQSAAQGLAGNFILTEDLQAEIEVYLTERWQLSLVDSTRIGIAMIAQLRERHFILCLYGLQVYGFVHRTFLEYFCAAEIVHRFEKRQTLSFDKLKTAIFLTHYQDAAWHEVLRLICGMIQPRFAGRLIDTIVPDRRTAFEETDHLILAIQCLAEVAYLNEIAEVAQRVLEAVCGWFEGTRRWMVNNPDEKEQNFEENAVPAVEFIGKSWPERERFLPWLSEPTKETSRSGVYAFGRTVAALWGDNAKTKEALIALSETENYRMAFDALARCFSEQEDILLLFKHIVTNDQEQFRRAAAVNSLAEHYTQNPEVLPLIKQAATDDKSGRVRSAAVEFLAKHYTQNPEFLRLIMQVATDDKDRWVRRTAVKSLAEHDTQNPEVLPLIMQVATDDEDKLVRRAAVKSLAKHNTQNPEVLPLIMQVATDGKYEDVRRAAVEFLAKHNTQNPEVLPLIMQVATDDKHEDVRRAAVKFLAEHGTQNPEVLPLIMQVATNDKHENVRRAAVEFLAEHGTQNPEVLPLIMQVATNDKHENVRRAAVEFLAEHGIQNPEVLPLIMQVATDDKDSWVRRVAVEYLAKHHSQNPEVSELIKQFATDGKHENVRRTAVEYLAKYYTQNSEVLPLIMQVATNDKEESVRRAAVESLAEHGNQNPEVLPLIMQVATNGKHADVRNTAVEFLAEHGTQNPEVLPLIMQAAIDDEDEWVRSTAVYSLAKRAAQNPEVLALIKQVATDDKHEDVRSAAVYSLAKYYTQNPEVLLLIKQVATDDKHEYVRRAAVGYLAEHDTQNPEVLSLLSKILTDDEDADVRQTAVGGVVKNDDEIWQKLLLKDFRQKSWWWWEDWLDSKALIDEERIEAASKALGLSPETIRQHYEDIAKKIPLRLSWIQNEK
jgi:HEAT repeat protein